MGRRAWATITVLVLGGSLLTYAGLAHATHARAGLKRGGIFLFGEPGAAAPIDPQRSFNSVGWWLEYATAAQLFNYPDAPAPAGTRLMPEVASRFAVSSDGKTYTFWIRKGFRFSDGSPVTARNFAYAIDRAANHTLNSPAAQYIVGPAASGIEGAAAVLAGDARHVHGVTVKGNRLTIRLTDPDGAFMAKLATPFFQATSTKLPLTREVVDVARASDLPSAGPYAFTRNSAELTSLRRNPYWQRGPGRRRPRHLDGLDVHWGLSDQGAFDGLEGDLDEILVPPDKVAMVADRFGVNRGRFWVEPVQCVGYIGFNNHRGVFAHNPQLRKAVSWAIDRTAYANLAGPYAGSPWTHLLPPTTPGSVLTRRRQPYSVHPNLAKARSLAQGHLNEGKVVIGYRASGTVGPPQADLIRDALIQVGFNPDDITLRGYSGGICDPLSDPRCGPGDLDITALGWCSDVPDPATFFDLILAKGPWPWGSFYWTLNSPSYRRKLAAAKRLIGDARLAAFGKLDLDLMRNSAPVIALRTYNNRFLFSDRVDPRSLVYQPAYTDWSIPALALK